MFNQQRLTATTGLALANQAQGVSRDKALEILTIVTQDSLLAKTAVEAAYGPEDKPVITTPEQFAQALTEKFADQKYASRIFTVDSVGPKYTRIAQETALEDLGALDGRPGYTNKSVHCFIENSTGHVYKSASWKTPAKGVRFTSMTEALEAADVHGGYLYKR